MKNVGEGEVNKEIFVVKHAELQTQKEKWKVGENLFVGASSNKKKYAQEFLGKGIQKRNESTRTQKKKASNHRRDLQFLEESIT